MSFSVVTGKAAGASGAALLAESAPATAAVPDPSAQALPLAGFASLAFACSRRAGRGVSKWAV